MKIEIASQFSEELCAAFQRLIPQLTENHPPPTADEVAAFLEDETSTLIIARNDNREIIGSLAIAVYHVPTGVRAIIEDVVVDLTARRKGLGEALMMKAIEVARAKNAESVSLTSNPIREEANRLYLRMGFVKRETNNYQIKL